MKKSPTNRNELTTFIFFTSIIVAYAAFISIKNIGNGFFWDDFHLIRSFSVTELEMVWHGNWDPDQIETPGYRPLTVYFNFFRYLLFGENTVAHRVFLMALFVIIIIAWGHILRKFGMSNFFYLIISLLVLSARNSAYHFTWIADGIHLFQGILFVASIWFLLLSFGASKKVHTIAYFILSLGIYAISLLVREESVVIFGAIVLLCVFFVFSKRERKTKSNICNLIIYILSGAIITLAIYLIGKHYVLEENYSFYPEGFLQMLRFTMFFAGFRSGSNYYFIATLPVILVSTTLLLSKYRKRKIDSKNYFLFILLIIIVFISCLPGLYVNRSNLTFFSNIFYCTWLGLGFYIFLDYFRHYRIKPILYAVILIFFLLVIIESTKNNLLLQESTAYPISNLIYTPDFIWGWASNATIPEIRRNKSIHDLEQLGITQENYSTEIPTLLCDAYNNKIFHPTIQHDIFFPIYFVFYDDGWYPIGCSK